MQFSLILKRKAMAARVCGMLVFCLCLFACSAKTATSAQAELINSLGKKGVTVNTVGESVTILLPSDSLFVVNSANIQVNYRPILAQVAQLLQTYILVSVKVTAYSDATAPLDLQALTTKQAQVVANALWDQGIDTRLVSAEGGGNSQLVVQGGTNSQRAPNRRVEISFRYYPAVSYYD